MIALVTNRDLPMGEKMPQLDDDGVRDLGSPFRVFSPLDRHELYDVDFHPQVVRADELHPSEVVNTPKAPDEEEPSSAPESATDSSTLVKSNSPAGSENPVPAEKESTEIPGLEDLDFLAETKDGDETPPAATPPLPPAKTPSSRSAVKSS